MADVVCRLYSVMCVRATEVLRCEVEVRIIIILEVELVISLYGVILLLG